MTERERRPRKLVAPVPLVLHPHGGPCGRDQWGYDPFYQGLANRGYGVLSVNFRGSTGFGKGFINASNLEWGRKMHDDLIDAVDDGAPEVAMFCPADDPGELSDLATEAAHAEVRAELLRRPCADWDPAVVRAALEEANRDWRLLVAHGKLFQSPHECAPTLPADEFFTQR
jgi:hypothetical protein